MLHGLLEPPSLLLSVRALYALLVLPREAFCRVHSTHSVAHPVAASLHAT